MEMSVGRFWMTSIYRWLRFGTTFGVTLLAACAVLGSPQSTMPAAQPATVTPTAMTIQLRSLDNAGTQLVTRDHPASFQFKVENLGDVVTSIDLKIESNTGWDVTTDTSLDNVSLQARQSKLFTVTVAFASSAATTAQSGMITVKVLDNKTKQELDDRSLSVRADLPSHQEQITLKQLVDEIEATMRIKIRAGSSVNLLAEPRRDAESLGDLADETSLVIHQLPVQSGSGQTWLAVTWQAPDGSFKTGWVPTSQTDYDALNLPASYPPPISNLATETPAVLFNQPEGQDIEVILTRSTPVVVAQIRPEGDEKPRALVKVDVEGFTRLGWVDLCRTDYPTELIKLWARRVGREAPNLPQLVVCR